MTHRSTKLATAALLALVFLLAQHTDAFAQTSLFWQPVTGVHATLQYTYLAADSSVGTTDGTGEYVYVSSDSSWHQLSGEQETGFLESRPYRARVVLTIGDTVYAVVQDTLYSTFNLGRSWQVAAIFPAMPWWMQATLSGTVIVDLRNDTLYLSTDAFRHITKRYVPEGIRGTFAERDRILVASKRGNLLASDDLAMTWRTLLSGRDTNYHYTLSSRGDQYLACGFDQATAFPWYDSNVTVTYSSDRGNHWKTGSFPATTVDGVAVRGITDSIALITIPSDWYLLNIGSWQWTKLDQGGYIYIDKFGRLIRELYEGLMAISYDTGKTWDTLTGRGINPSILGVQGTRFATLMTTPDSLFVSPDAATWHSIGPWGAALGRIREHPDSITLNGLLLSYDSALDYGHIYSRMVGITTMNGALTFIVRLGATTIQETLDHGISWLPSDTLPGQVSGLYRLVGDTILIAGPWGLFRTSDLRIPFDTVTPPAGTTGAVAIDSSGHVYAAGNDGKLYIGDSNAEHWTAYDGPGGTSTTEHTRAICITPGGELYAVSYDSATELSYVSMYTIATHSWQRIESGLSRANMPTVEPVSIWYASDYVWLGTDNAGPYRSAKKVDGKASVQPIPSATAIQAYPNPTMARLTLQYPQTTSPVHYRIVDAAGRDIQDGTIAVSTTNTTITIQTLPPGAYELTTQHHWKPLKFVVER